MSTPTTDHRAGRMMTGLLASANARAKLVITCDLLAADGRRYHQTFNVKKWQGRDDTTMLTVEVKGSGWPATRVLHINTATGRESVARESEDDKLLVFAARACMQFAYTGTVPTPRNGTVEVTEEDVCSCCGLALTDPVSLERGMGPECYGKQTGSKTITGRKKAPLATA